LSTIGVYSGIIGKAHSGTDISHTPPPECDLSNPAGLALEILTTASETHKTKNIEKRAFSIQPIDESWFKRSESLDSSKLPSFIF
jgi:hypothetical protein